MPLEDAVETAGDCLGRAGCPPGAPGVLSGVLVVAAPLPAALPFFLGAAWLPVAFSRGAGLLVLNLKPKERPSSEESMEGSASAASGVGRLSKDVEAFGNSKLKLIMAGPATSVGRAIMLFRLLRASSAGLANGQADRSKP